MANPTNKRLGVIAGPTASGKTALALRLAERHDITIINADSAQVYTHLPILSAQPSDAEKASAPHRLFGYLSGQEICSSARWAVDAKAEIENAWAKDSLPLLVGGTGLYLRTLLDGIAPIPEIDPTVRNDVRQMETADARAALEAEDALSAKALAPSDDSRIKRALEVVRSTGRTMKEWQEAKTGGIGNDVLLSPMILLPPRDWLHDRCNARFEGMIAAGAVEEVEALLEMNLPLDAPIMRAIGVPAIAALLNGKIDAAEAVSRGQASTRQYAKRQYTWFRNQPPADWTRSKEVYNDSNIDIFERLFHF